MSIDLINTIKRGSISLLVNNILTIISQLIIIVILSKILNPKDFGYQGTCLMLMDLTVVFTYPSINKSIILKKDVSPEFIDSAIVLSFFLCLGAGLVFLTTAFFLYFIFNSSNYAFVCLILFIIFIVKGLYQSHQALFEKALRFKETSRFSLIAYWIGYFFTPLFFSILHFGYKSLLIGILVNEITLLVLYLKGYKLKIFIPRREIIREILLDSKNLIINSFFNQLATNGDYLVVSIFLGPKALGYYTQGYKIMKMPTTIIGNIINNMSFASFSKINSDNEKLSKAFLYLSFILAIFSFPICLVSFFYSKEIVILLLGKNWLPTADVLKIFSIGIFLRMSYKIPGTILRAKSLFSLTAKLQIVYAANVIFLSIIFIRLSINGVAAATTIALLIQYALSTYFVNLSLKKNPYYFYTILIKPFLISTLYVFSVGTILFILDKESIFSHNYNFLVVTGFFTLIYSYIIYRYGILFFGKPYEWWIKLIKK